MKRIGCILLTAFIVVQSLSCLAYDEEDVTKYLDQIAPGYSELNDVDEAQDDIIDELINSYHCTEDEAHSIFADFRVRMENTFADEKNNQNTDDEKKDDSKLSEEKMLLGADIKKDVLAQLKIVPDGEADYKKNVTRGEFSLYVANLMSYGRDYSSEDGYFKYTDIDEESPYYRSAAYLTNRGVMVGHGDGTFDAEGDITAEQAGTVLVKLLGYEKIKPDNAAAGYYIIKANELGLFKGAAIKNGNAPISFGQLITVLLNTMEADTVKSDMVDGNVGYTDNNTFMQSYMKLNYKEDVVSANSKTSLYSENGGVNINQLMVGDSLFEFESEKELDSYLGKKVRVYYDMENTEMAKAITEPEGYNSYTHVTSTETERYDALSNRLYYTPAASSKEKYETVRRDAAIIFNGCAVSYEHDKSLMFMPDAGEITFIDNNKDSYADVIIIKSYVYYISGIINKETPVLHDKAGIQPDIELDGGGGIKA